MKLFYSLALICALSISSAYSQNNETHRVFPDDFLFGTATASFVVEGGWNASDKSEQIWDRLAHTTNLIRDGSNADVACDSYHKYARDVEMLTELEVKFYRFSLSWSRILPSGFNNKISVDGVAYYNNLIDLLILNNITPVITIFHWDLPQSLQDLGGWANPLMEKYFIDYARVVFDKYGDRVKLWLTFNEPYEICESGYGDASKAPVVKSMGVGDYLCTHTLLKAHASVYHLYDEVYRPIQKGRIGMSISGAWYEPEDSESPEDGKASESGLQFTIGWHAHPIYTEEGDYPSLMKERIAQRSLEQGFSTSRLPSFTPEEVNYIKGTADFFGLNHYTSVLARHVDNSEFPSPSYQDDINVIEFQPDEWISAPGSSWLKVVPWAFTKLLVWLKNEYNNPEIMIFENGLSDQGGTDDQERIQYYHLYLNALLDAMEQGVNVTAYTAWSLMDNWELTSGYTDKFGLYEVDFNDPDRTRTPKASSRYYTELIRTKTLLRA